jgi:hypothetical protein
MPSISFIIGFVTFLIVKSALPTLAQFEGDHINTGPNHSVAFIQDTETGAQREAEALRLRFPVRCYQNDAPSKREGLLERPERERFSGGLYRALLGRRRSLGSKRHNATNALHDPHSGCGFPPEPAATQPHPPDLLKT